MPRSSVLQTRQIIGIITMVLLVSFVSSVMAEKAVFELDRHSCILISAGEPRWVQLAARDLQKDIQQLCSVAVPIVNEKDKCTNSVIVIATRGEALLASMGPCICEKDWGRSESFVIRTLADPWNADPSHNVLLISGYDPRGTLYGVYTLSEEYLGIDPLYYWTGYQPVPTDKLLLEIDRCEPSPTFSLRGFFINDEDLLCGWKGDAGDIELEIYEAIFETMVRLKFNMGISCTWQLPTDPELPLMAERGLMLSQHHIQNMGADPACGWDTFWKGEDVAYSYQKNQKRFHEYWTASVKSWEGFPGDIIWQTGLRGKGDKPFWIDDPFDPGTPKARGALIQNAVENQIKMLKDLITPAPRFFTTTLWMDMIELYSKGYIDYPPEIRIIWCDNGEGAMRSMRSDTIALPQEKTGGHDGIYYHVDFQNDWYNQLCQTVPPTRMKHEFCRPGGILDKECTAYAMLNVGDIRHVVMGIKAFSELVWNADPWRQIPDYSEQFYDRWCEKHFGTEAGESAKHCYKALFECPWQHGKFPDQKVGIQGLMHCARILLEKQDKPTWTMYTGSHTTQGHCDILKDKCGRGRKTWDDAWQLAQQTKSLVPSEKRQFFEDDVMLQIGISRACNDYLYYLAQAVEQEQQGHLSRANDFVQQALLQLEQVFSLEKSAEWGKWKNWYANDGIAGIPRTYKLTKQYGDALTDQLKVQIQ